MDREQLMKAASDLAEIAHDSGAPYAQLLGEDKNGRTTFAIMIVCGTAAADALSAVQAVVQAKYSPVAGSSQKVGVA